ncbi:MAG TPA: creatininase family protein [Candidatus Xenobia bacterium]|jgi:creatinine amidohydrolase
MPSASGIWLENLTWAEAEPLLAAAPVLLLPLGARLKEHGLHLPLNNDWLLAEYLARRVVAQVPVVALPTLDWHYYPAFVEYPGSVSLELETSRRMVVEVCRSLTRFGPRQVYVLNTGVSTEKSLALAAGDLQADGVTLRYTRLHEALAAVPQEQEGGTHADEVETSMMLYITPERVHMDRALLDYQPENGPGPLRRQPGLAGVYSPTGAWGDPTRASREKGERAVEALISWIINDIREQM